MSPTPTISGPCRDGAHDQCNGNARNQQGYWVVCQCSISGCTCAVLTRQAAANAG